MFSAWKILLFPMMMMIVHVSSSSVARQGPVYQYPGDGKAEFGTLYVLLTDDEPNFVAVTFTALYASQLNAGILIVDDIVLQGSEYRCKEGWDDDACPPSSICFAGDGRGCGRDEDNDCEVKYTNYYEYLVEVSGNTFVLQMFDSLFDSDNGNVLLVRTDDEASVQQLHLDWSGFSATSFQSELSERLQEIDVFNDFVHEAFRRASNHTTTAVSH